MLKLVSANGSGWDCSESIYIYDKTIKYSNMQFFKYTYYLYYIIQLQTISALAIRYDYKKDVYRELALWGQNVKPKTLKAITA